MTDSAVRALARRLEGIERQLRGRATQLEHSALEDGAIREFDLEGEQQAQYGKQWDDTHVAATLRGPVPPEPSTPDVAPVPGGLLVGWDGFFAAGLTTVAPMDFARVDIVVGPNAMDPIATPPSAAVMSPRGGSAFISLPEGDYDVVLVTRSVAGIASIPSDPVFGSALPLSGDAGVDQAARDLAQQAIDDAAAAAALASAAQTAADASATIYRQSSAPTTGMTDNDLWVDADDGLLYVYVGGVWTLSADQRVAALVSSTATKITSFAQASTPSTVGRTTGDIWVDTDDGHKLYVWDGAWTARLLGGTALAADSIDGKTITGAFYRTAANGARWELKGGGFANTLLGYSGYASEVAPGGVVATNVQNGMVAVQGPNIGNGQAALQLSNQSGGVTRTVAELFAKVVRVTADTYSLLSGGGSYVEAHSAADNYEGNDFAKVGVYTQTEANTGQEHRSFLGYAWTVFNNVVSHSLTLKPADGLVLKLDSVQRFAVGLVSSVLEGDLNMPTGTVMAGSDTSSTQRGYWIRRLGSGGVAVQQHRAYLTGAADPALVDRILKDGVEVARAELSATGLEINGTRVPKETFGTHSGTSSAGGANVITHNLGVVPTFFDTTNNNSGRYTAPDLSSATTTQITVYTRVLTSAGAPVSASAAQVIMWQAKV